MTQVQPPAVMTLEVFLKEWEQKKPKTRAACTFCGQFAPRSIMGLRWIPVDDQLSTQIDMSKNDGMLPCVILSCNGCGLVSHLNLMALGIVHVGEPPKRPQLTLIEGGGNGVGT